MPFSPRIKHLAKIKSAFHCCICHRPFVEVHHLIPQAEGGLDTLDNAAPLCAACHDLYGGNPEKRNALKQMRDHWWDLMDQRRQNITDPSELSMEYEIEVDESHQGALHTSRALIYHRTNRGDTFEAVANVIVDLIYKTQQSLPNTKRLIFLDIARPRKKDRRYERDMCELQLHFLGGLMIEFISELHTPLIHIRNEKWQNNKVPSQVKIFPPDISASTINEAFESGIQTIHMANGKRIDLSKK